MAVIVILAMIFAFLALRLYSVLGKRTGAEQQLPAPADDRSIAPPPVQPTADVRSDPARLGEAAIAPGAQAGIRAIIGADRGFDVSRFLIGARSAYAMILEAFWSGDKARLGELCDDDVNAAFSEAIDQRQGAGHVLDNRLVRIDGARITDASIDGGAAQIAVLFEADIAAITRDADGAVIAGTMEDAIPTRETWTFARDVRANNPDWTLVATDEACRSGDVSPVRGGDAGSRWRTGGPPLQ